MNTTTATENLTGERADLLDTLHKHRELFRVPARGVDDEQARTRSTISELTHTFLALASSFFAAVLALDLVYALAQYLKDFLKDRE